jgi:hypothetical protein
MATKNLARTVIEGGRSGSSRYEARHETRRERRKVKHLLHGDRDFDGVTFPRRGAFELVQNDKVNPAIRWITSNCGRPWRKVYSELVTTFDTRTIPGGHVVFNHMLTVIAEHGTLHADREMFVIDRNGILRRNKKYRWRR